MIKRVVFDVQHLGKPEKPFDRGANYSGYNESDLALKYATLAFQQLTAKGYETFLITSGTYQERHEWINRYNIDLYLACHLNAGGGSYSLVEYYYDAGQRTRLLADLMANSFKTILGTSTAKVWEIAKDGRGAACIQNTKPSALLLEPLFIDNDEHLQLAIKRPESIAQAIVQSVLLSK